MVIYCFNVIVDKKFCIRVLRNTLHGVPKCLKGGKGTKNSERRAPGGLESETIGVKPNVARALDQLAI